MAAEASPFPMPQAIACSAHCVLVGADAGGAVITPDFGLIYTPMEGSR